MSRATSFATSTSPHEAIISLVNVMEDGATTEVAVFGREGAAGLLSPLVTREAFGRYIVQMSGTASRISFEHLNGARNARRKLGQLTMRYGGVVTLTRT